MSVLVLFCFIKGGRVPIKLIIPTKFNVFKLKTLIHEKAKYCVLRESDSKDLWVWKLHEPEPLEPEKDLSDRLRARGDLSQIAEKLNSSVLIGSVFKEQPQKGIHLIIDYHPSPTISPSSCRTSNISAHASSTAARKRDLDGIDPDEAKRKRHKGGKSTPKTDDLWLMELHSKLWGRKNLLPSLLRTAHITVERFYAWQKGLTELHKDRDSDTYRAKDVLPFKLQFLRSCDPATSLSSSEQPSHGEPVGTNTEESNDIAAELGFTLPKTIEYLDLSSLQLRYSTPRLPLPLLYRHEYKVISEMINEESSDSDDSVIVSGQPGTGKTTLIYLLMIQSLIAGDEFLFQTFDGAVYHVADNVTPIKSWSSTEPIIAFVDVDKTVVPQSILQRSSIKVIAAASPANARAKLWKQGDSSSFLFPMVVRLWEPFEFFMTGMFLHPMDLTFVRLQEAVSYFGLNPRQCFDASQHPSDLNHSKTAVLAAMHSISTRETLRNLLIQAFTTKGVSHSIFELSPQDDKRILDEAHVGVVSSWALDMLLKEYETRKADAAAEFYDSLAGKPYSYAESVRGRLFERQVLKYFDPLKDACTFSIRSLSTSATLQWPGSTQRVTFQSESFTSSLETAVKDKTPLRLVPADRTFRAVDFVLYDPTAPLTLVQITHRRKHPVAVSGLQRVQSELKLGTDLAALRPSVSGTHWRLIFVVPDTLAPDFALQVLEEDTAECGWARKVDQYVLGVGEDTIWGRTMNID